MKVILVNGSPHKQGCTFTALSEIEAVLQKSGIETEIFHIGTQPIAGCIACGKCKREKTCVAGDIVNEFADKAKTADGLIFGSPVHYAAAAGPLTAFMDRLFYAHGKSFKGKPAAAIVSCRRGGSTAALDQLLKYFSICQMPIVTSQYWNMVHGNNPDEVMQDLEGLQIMRTLGSNMAWLLKCIEAGSNNGITLPENEQRVWTNFIR